MKKEMWVFTKRDIDKVVDEIILKLNDFKVKRRPTSSSIITGNFNIIVTSLDIGSRAKRIPIILYDNGFTKEELGIMECFIPSNPAFRLGDRNKSGFYETLLVPLEIIDQLIKY